MDDGRGRGHADEDEDEDMEGARSAQRDVNQGDRPEDDERAGEEPPRPPDVRFLRVGGVRCG
jgi:hypothetical protein